MISAATGPAQWVHDEDGTYDPEAICHHCDCSHGQVLRGGGSAVWCRCTNITCARTFLHALWPLKPPRTAGPREQRGLAVRRGLRALS